MRDSESAEPLTGGGNVISISFCKLARVTKGLCLLEQHRQDGLSDGITVVKIVGIIVTIIMVVRHTVVSVNMIHQYV